MMQSDKKATQEWVDMFVQSTLKDYVPREEHQKDIQQIRGALWGPSTDGREPELQKLWGAIGSKLEKPSIWGIVIPIIVAMVTWAASKTFGSPLG